MNQHVEAIMEAGNLDELCAALNAGEIASGDGQIEGLLRVDGADLTMLPKFSDYPPFVSVPHYSGATMKPWSWDATRVIVDAAEMGFRIATSPTDIEPYK